MRTSNLNAGNPMRRRRVAITSVLAVLRRHARYAAAITFAAVVLAGCNSGTAADDGPMRVKLHAIVDGESIEPKYLESIVLRDDGTVHLCTASKATVEDGLGLIDVLSEKQQQGCGATGTKVWFSLVANGKILFGARAVDWRRSDAPQETELEFSTSDPPGAAQRYTLISLDFQPVVENTSTIYGLIDGTVCGYAPAVDSNSDFEYVFLAISGPELIPSCHEGAAIDVKVGDEIYPAVTTNDFAINSFRPVVAIER